MKQALLQTLLVLAAAGVSAGASAQAASKEPGYPNKPIRVVVPFTAGSATDIIARIIGPKLVERWSLQVVTDNRPSAGGIVAFSIVAGATPDGHTLLVTGSNFAGSAALYSKLPYDPVRDFSGINAVHVPYRGSPESLTDLMAGRVHFILSPVLAATSLIKSGRLLALGVTTTYRAQGLPDVPTVAEAGLAGFEYQGWYGMLAPSRTPRRIINLLSREVGRTLELGDIKERIANQGAAARPSTPEEFDKLIRDEITTRTKVWKAAGVKAE